MPNRATVFMMTHVLRNLPTAKQHAWVCSSGSRGYCAVKEMLQNGSPGHTLLLESDDLRDVDASSEGCCLLVYCFTDEYTVMRKVSTVRYRDHIPRTVRHVGVYANTNSVPRTFLQECTGLTTLDLSPLSQLTKIYKAFLSGCTKLTTLDLSPLSQVREVHGAFLQGCTGLTTLDLSPLSQVREVDTFLEGCTELTTLDLSPLSQVMRVHEGFLRGCTGLTALDLSPLSQLTKIYGEFLQGCTGLTSLDFGPLTQLRKVHESSQDARV